MTSSAPVHDPIRRVLLIGKIGPEQGPRLADEIGRWLENRGVDVRFDMKTASALGRPNGVRRGSLPERSLAGPAG